MSTPFLKPEFGRCHLVILGAGASRAALPNGDKRGRTLPLMNDLVDTLGLRPLLEDHGLHADSGDFEARRVPELICAVWRAGRSRPLDFQW